MTLSGKGTRTGRSRTFVQKVNHPKLTISHSMIHSHQGNYLPGMALSQMQAEGYATGRGETQTSIASFG